MKKIILFLPIIAFANFLCGQSSKYISLKDALELAEKNYPHLKAKDWNIRSAQENLTSTKESVFIPALKLHEQVDYATSNSVQGTYFSYGISTSGGIGTTNNLNPIYGSISV